MSIMIITDIERILGLIELGLLETANIQDPVIFAYCIRG